MASVGPGAPLTPIEAAPRPIRRDELRVRVRAIGVNPVDWKMRGLSPLGVAQRLLGPRGPQIPGIDFSGEVIELGAAVSSLALGARVVGGVDFSRGQRGSYADEVVVRRDQCAVIPDAVSFEAAAALPVPGATAWRALVELGGLRAERPSRVLVLGASGGVGVIATQLARTLGAEVTGVCSSRNAALVSRLGATAVDYTQGDALLRAGERGPFDVVLNAVGTQTYPRAACEALCAPGGLVTLVVVRPGDYPSLLFTSRTRSVLGRPTRARLEPLLGAMARGELEAVIAEALPLVEAERAHALSRDGKVVGKLLLRP